MTIKLKVFIGIMVAALVIAVGTDLFFMGNMFVGNLMQQGAQIAVQQVITEATVAGKVTFSGSDKSGKPFSLTLVPQTQQTQK